MEKIKQLFSKIFDRLAKCVSPMMIVFVGCGMLKVINVLIGPKALNIFADDSPTLLVLRFVADAGYYYMPVFAGISTAEVFHTNKFLGALMGALLLSPDYINYVNSGTNLSFFGLPVMETSYANQMLPAIISVFIMSRIYRFFDSHSPVQIKNIIVPLFTIIVMIPINFCFAGPIGYGVSLIMMKGILWLMSLGPVGPAIISALFPLQVMFGLTSANTTVMLMILAEGPDPGFYYSAVVFNIALGFCAIGVYLRTKDLIHLQGGLTACIAGIGQPALYDCMAIYPKALASLMIGNFVGTYYGVMMGVKTFSIGSCGVLGMSGFLGEGSNALQGVIGVAIGSAVAFILAFILNVKAPKTVNNK